MSQPIIQVENLAKLYKVGVIGARTLRESMSQWWQQRRGQDTRRVDASAHGFSPDRRGPEPDTFWALHDVSFHVAPGEVLGIIGRNGAGKSTLLKILSRITEPTSGRAILRGRLASLLEVGTGFHADLSGRENIYLNGAILGMKRAEIRRKFDEIVEFSEIGDFIDTPVKRYSSGMYVRLAFAVAAHLEPEILIVDEVLAVGDAQFQKRCLGKMEQVARGGRTVLFVSHNMQAVSTLTTRCLLMRDGRCVEDGAPAHVIARYLEDGSAAGQVYSVKPSTGKPELVRLALETSQPSNTQNNGKPMSIVLDIHTPEPCEMVSLSVELVNSMAQPVVHLWFYNSVELGKPGTHRLVCEIPKLRLYMGHHTVTVHIAEPEGGAHFQTIRGLCPFEIVMHGQTRDWTWRDGECCYVEDCQWRMEEPV